MEFVTFKIFDISGKEIQTIVNETLSAGTYKVTFDGSDLPSEIYFYKLEAGEFSQVRKMTLLK